MKLRIENEDNVLLLEINTDNFRKDEIVKLDFNNSIKDIAIGFAEFCGGNFGEYHEGIKLWQDCMEETYTTEELFNKYLNTLK